GLYTAAASVAGQQTVTISAASVADTTKTGSATVTLVSNVAVTVVPGSASLGQSGTFQFTAQVSNTANTGVTWTLNPNVGTMSGTGLYTAPASVTATQAVVVTATSASDPSKAGTAAITLVPPPALSISQTHSGAFTQGQAGSTYNVTVSNGAGAGPSNGTVTLAETLPTGLTLVSMAGTGWSCTGATCTRGDALSAGASYPAVTVTVNVAANAGTPLAAQVSMSGGGSPAATATDNTVITPTSVLGVSESHPGSFTQGQAGATYTVTVSNGVTAGPTAGTVTLTETLPVGLTLVSMAGTGWSCTGATCTRGDALGAGASYPAVTVTVNVAANAGTPLAAQVSMSGGGSPAATATDNTVITPTAVLSVSESHIGGFTQGQAGATYTIAISNGATAGPTAGTVTLNQNLPVGLTLVSMAGTGWSCTGATCTRGDALGAGASYPAVTVTVNVAANAGTPLAAQVSMSGGGSPAATATNNTVITPTAVLSVSESHTGNFAPGQVGATNTVTISNGATAGPTAGTVTLTETLPAGLTLVSMAGTGWSCTGATCTRGDALGAGASYPAVTVTVNVAANAPTPLICQVSVSGGGSPVATASDTVVLIAASGLSIAETHTGNFSQGQAKAVYTIVVSNQTAAGPTTGLVSVTEAAPAGITLVSMSGTGWACGGIACTRSDALNPGGSYPPITVTVNVDPAAPAQVTNTTTVSGGGSLTPSLSASDVTGINPITDVSGLVQVTETGFGVNRTTKLWNATMTIANTSGTAIKGPIEVVFTNLSPNAIMVNNNGARNGGPYITVSVGGLAAGASVTALIQFTNSTSGFINFTPQTVSGIF
ncbi:MAG TPA: hypothetical protein VNY05_15215, partial [Candidatus Acidoferrales bacterium]|nr:hypothetical protein [Candidatus Acidoferrales bacterium]